MPALPRNAPVVVIGAGTMGVGIAQVAALHGHPVQLHDARFGAGDAAKEVIGKAFANLVVKGKLTQDDADAALARITTVVTRPDACVAGLVVEAIVESVDAKRELFAGLENIVSPSCILASNTSSLSITALASGLRHPQRVIGMHFFNPVPVMPLVEVVHGLATDPAVADTVFETARAWGKTPVHARSTPGFVVNRCARPFYGEALRLLHERAATPASLDAILRDAGGFRMGPFELMDLIGLDVNLAVTRGVWEGTFNDPRYTPSVIQAELVAAGHLGRKSGRGFYTYDNDTAPPVADVEAATEPPPQVAIHGDAGTLAPLVTRLAASGVEVSTCPADSRFGTGVLRLGGAKGHAGSATLALTDGRTATARAVVTGVADCVLVDYALDLGQCTRVAVARADTCSAAGYALAVGALQACGIAVTRIDDAPGLVVLRTVAMLVNEAADALNQGIADAHSIDLAMCKGVNYPQGPFAWARQLGVGTVRDALAHIGEHYGDPRYRIAPLLARHARTGTPLDG
ncbi:MAG: 3-hydroxyacyl-CoA dehydrogenase [Casimicrobiaceae bacterium]